MHPHDETWVNEQINKLPLHLRPKILAKKSRDRLLGTINFEHGEKDDERT